VNGRGLQFHIPLLAPKQTLPLVNETLPQRWIGHTGPEPLALHCRPPRSPDMTPYDFFLWGYVKKKRVYVPKFPADLDELTNRFITPCAA
jgi:hypothetical protein